MYLRIGFRRLYKIIFSKKVFKYILDSNKYRTLFSSLNIFFPVTHKRWIFAQKSECSLWALPDNFEGVTHESFINEGKKSNFILNNALNIYGKTIESLVKDRNIIDIGCGPASFITHLNTPRTKIGIDPLPFPKWVIDNYQKSNFTLIQQPIEELSHIKFDGLDNPLVVMYNALQHFMNPYKGIQLISEKFSKHEILIVDYGYAPADNAHPQILTTSRIRRFLTKLDYGNIQVNLLSLYLPKLVQYGENKPPFVIVTTGQR